MPSCVSIYRSCCQVSVTCTAPLHSITNIFTLLSLFIQRPASCIRVTILIDHSYPACLKNSNNTFYYLFIYLHIFIEPTFQLDNIYYCHLNFIYYLHFAWINQVCNGSISTEEECPRPVHGSVVRRPRRLHFWTWTIFTHLRAASLTASPATGSSQSGFVFGDEEIRAVGYSSRERGNAIKINYLVSLQIIYIKPGRMIHTTLLVFAISVYICSVAFLYLKDFLPACNGILTNVQFTLQMIN